MFWMAQKKQLGNINLGIVKIRKYFPLSFPFFPQEKRKENELE
jgi:hypothetical protein